MSGSDRQATDAVFVDIEPLMQSHPRAWAPLHVPRQSIESQIQRLADITREPGQLRATNVVHPEVHDSVHGITPGMSISINVLRPGEQIVVDRDNCNRVEFAIRGDAGSWIGGRSLSLAKWSTWSVPSMQQRIYKNAGKELFVWLSYSNQPLLDRLGIYYSDTFTANGHAHSPPGEAESRYVRANAPDFPVLSDGARIRGYEFLTDIEVIENKPLLWPWAEVEKHVSRADGDGKRTIMLLYNPATERRNGTTPSFFATITSFPPGKLRPPPARGHRHSSYATNYHFIGGGSSVVDGRRFDWEAGDLMLSAPSWSEHSHGISDRGASVLTVQDHPFQIGIESLIWQERMDGPILTLGAEPGQTGYVGPRLAGASLV